MKRQSRQILAGQKDSSLLGPKQGVVETICQEPGKRDFKTIK